MAHKLNIGSGESAVCCQSSWPESSSLLHSAHSGPALLEVVTQGLEPASAKPIAQAQSAVLHWNGECQSPSPAGSDGAR
jgi:hypothetical protein